MAIPNMVGKKIDYYVSWNFLLPFGMGLLLTVSLYSSFDVLKKIDEIQEAGGAEALPTVVAYYGYMLPLFLVDIAPALVLVAAGLALVKMSRARELTVLKASGVSLYRTAGPILVWGVIISAVLFCVRETVGPRLGRQSEVLDHKISDRTESGLLMRDEKHNFQMFVSQYNFADNSMERVCIFVTRPDKTIDMTIEADSASLTGGGTLRLKSAKIQRFNEDGNPTANLKAAPSLEMETSLQPFDFSRAESESGSARSMFISLPTLREKIKENPQVPFYKVMFHYRLASTLTPVLLLLVGIPILVGFERSTYSRFLCVIICIVVAGGYYVLSFVFSSMGITGTIDAVLAGWLPVLIVGPSGLWLFESMLT